MFHKATESLAKQLDPGGDLIPVYSLLDQIHFSPLFVVQRKTEQPWWKKCRYHKTGRKLCDLLLPGDSTAQLDIYESDLATIVDNVDGKLEGDMSVVTDVANLAITSSATMSHARSVKVKKRHVSTQVLDSLHSDRKINMDHPLIKQSARCQRDLYVVTETVETVQEVEFRESNKTESSILAELRVKMKMMGHRDSKKAVILPKDCVLAFRVKRLLIREGSLGISYFPDDKRKTFDSKIDNYQEDGAVESKTGSQLGEIERECEQLGWLTAELRGKFFNGFLAIIRDSDLLQELEIQVDQALDEINPIKLETCIPELQNLLENLQDPAGDICPEIGAPVLFFLQALGELSETELMLLEESVERKIVPKQVALVQYILENNAGSPEKNLCIDTEAVSPFIQDELDITEAMLKLRGVTVRRSGARLAVTGNTDAFLALSALYVALYVLDVLSK